MLRLCRSRYAWDQILGFSSKRIRTLTSNFSRARAPSGCVILLDRFLLAQRCGDVNLITAIVYVLSHVTIE